MTVNLRDQLRELCAVIENEQEPLTVDFVRSRSDAPTASQRPSPSLTSEITIIDDRLEESGSLDASVDSAAEPGQADPDGRDAPSRRKGWLGVAIAVAATILVVAGVVVVVDGDIGDVITDQASRPTIADPVPPAGESDTSPPPSVTDSLGYRWSRVPDDQSGFGADGGAWVRSVVAGGPGFVAVGSNNDWPAVWTSSDGVAWSRVPFDDAIFPSGAISSVIVGGPGLVAVGYVQLGTVTAAAVWTSPDGDTWSRVSHDEAVFGGPGHQRMLDATIGGPALVAVGHDEITGVAVWTSADGFTWSRVSPSDLPSGDVEDSMGAVTAGGPGLVAVGGDSDDDYTTIPAVWTSTNGISWSKIPGEPTFSGDSGGYPRISSVTTGGPGLVAVGWIDGHAAVWTSTDGVAWSRVPHDERIFGGSWAGMSDVIDVGSGLIAVGTSDGHAVVWTSPEGVAWSRVPHDGALFGAPISEEALHQAANRGVHYGMAAVTAGPSGLVAVGHPFDAVVWGAEPEN